MPVLVVALLLGFTVGLPVPALATTYVVTGATLQQCTTTRAAPGDPLVETCAAASPASVVGSFDVEPFLGIHVLDWDLDIDVANAVFEEYLPEEMYGPPSSLEFSVWLNVPFELVYYVLNLGLGGAHLEVSDTWTNLENCSPLAPCTVEYLRLDAAAVPEPTTALLATLGLAALGFVSRRGARRASP